MPNFSPYLPFRRSFALGLVSPWAARRRCAEDGAQTQRLAYARPRHRFAWRAFAGGFAPSPP